jgi:hypothetical protein
VVESLSGSDPPWIQTGHLGYDVPKALVHVIPHREGLPGVVASEFLHHSQHEVASFGTLVVQVVQEANEPRAIPEVREETLHDDALLIALS